MEHFATFTRRAAQFQLFLTFCRQIHDTRQDVQFRDAESNIVRLITLFIFLYRCGVCWLQDHVCLDCSECGGYSLQRPCPLCDGRCASPWKRDLTLVSTIQHLQCTHIHAIRTCHQLMSCPNCFVKIISLIGLITSTAVIKWVCSVRPMTPE